MSQAHYIVALTVLMTISLAGNAWQWQLAKMAVNPEASRAVAAEIKATNARELAQLKARHTEELERLNAALLPRRRGAARRPGQAPRGRGAFIRYAG